MKKCISFAFFSLFAIIIGCACANVDYSYRVYVTGENGEDLLDPKVANSYKKENINVYYRDKYGYYKNTYFSIEKNTEDDLYSLNLYLSNEVNSETGLCETYIKWGEEDVDTIQSNLYRKDCFDGYNKSWYNGEMREGVAGGHWINVKK